MYLLEIIISKKKICFISTKSYVKTIFKKTFGNRFQNNECCLIKESLINSTVKYS